MLMWRATRTREPARSISISVGLVSSSSNASSRIRAPSSLSLGVTAGLVSGWRAIFSIRTFKGLMLMRQAEVVAVLLAPILAARPLMARRYPSMPKPHRLANAALAVKERCRELYRA